jgi:ribonuclease P protein component
MRFRAEQHLRRPGEIRAVREQGQRLECSAFTVWWKRRDVAGATGASTEITTPAPVSPPARVCVIASTSAVGNAVRRNRAKRRLRELFRLQQSAVPDHCDLLLIARRSLIHCPTSELKARFSDACRRIVEASRPPS